MSSPPKQRMYVYAGHLRAKLTRASSWPRQKIAALEGWPRPGAQCSLVSLERYYTNAH